MRRLNLADGEPFALVTVWCPDELGAELSRADVERSPFYELLPHPLGGASQTIGAAAAIGRGRRAARRAARVARPAVRAGDADRRRRAGAGLEHVFPAHRTEFVVDLPRAEPSIAPTGLRLVE